MSDLIERNKLLKTFVQWQEENIKDYSNDEWNLLVDVINEIKGMPPATDNNVGTKLGTNLAEVGTDCISRQAAIEALERNSCNTQRAIDAVNALPSAQPEIIPEIIYCKDCVKHNKGHGYYLDGTVIGNKDCCPLIEIRGMAQGHEFDYQYCVYAERRTDD